MADFEPLYTAAEMRAAEAGHDVEQLMQRAGRAVADEVSRRFPEARLITAVCGGGANGGDGRIAIEILRAAGREAKVGEDGEPVGSSDVVIDALFGTGFRGEPRAEAAEAIADINASGARVVAVDTSTLALTLASENVRRLGLDVELREEGVEAAARGWDLVVSNPPYVSEDALAAADPELGWEPREALVDTGLYDEIVMRGPLAPAAA
jgi:hypothetical protein